MTHPLIPTMNPSSHDIHHYNQKHHGLESASVIVDYLVSILDIRPNSVIDVGCGLGQWLKVFAEACHSEVLGIDGSHVPVNISYISETNRLRVDLSDFIYTPTTRTYDLVLCLEVAEHLDLDHSVQIVDKLVSLGDIILFSAAIPGQTGENHVNEQPHHFWIDMFESKGYLVLDPFRRHFWNDCRVNWWYAQNLFLVCKPSRCPQHVRIHKYDHNMYIHPSLLDLYRHSLCVPSDKSSLALFSRLKSVIKSVLR